jgi:hypothetical protein
MMVRGKVSTSVASPSVQLKSFPNYYFKYSQKHSNHVSWFCHHDMERPQFADGGEELQIRRVAANMLTKQSRTADMSSSSSFGVGHGAKNLSP